MNFATWSIKNPIPAILFFIMMTFAGLYGFRNLPIQNFPDIELPTINVSLSLPGAAPAQLETEVARKVENSIATLSGIKHIMTSITDGQVTIIAEFVLEKELSDALIETKDAVDQVRSDLPTDLLPPTVSAVNIGGAPLITYSVTSERMNETDLSWFIDDKISKTLLGVKGVGQFDRLGGVNREVRVEVDPVRMAALNVTANDISHALKSIQVESSGGRGQLGQVEQSVRTIATVKQASDLKALSISLADGRHIRLDQVADISDTYADAAQAALLDGKPAVGFQIFRSKGFDETKIAESVAEALKKLEDTHPGLKFTEVSNTVDYTMEQYRGSMDMLYEGAFLAVLVVWFFLRDWRATLISAAALPLSMIPTFAAMEWLGYSLNTLTLLAQAVVVGILVDDAIVEIENIARHKQMGKSIREAATDAVNEIAMAVIATTLTLVVVFLPTSLMSGVSGLFFKQFGWTIVISVMASLLVARLLTPVMAVYFMKDEVQPHRPDGWIMTKYLALVRWCLGHMKSTMTFALLFLVTTFVLAGKLPAGFVPASDIGFTMINMELPPGSSLKDSVNITENVRKAIQDVEGIEHIFSAVGVAQMINGGQMQAGEVRKATITVQFLPRGERPSQTDIENNIRARLKNIAGARFALGTGNVGEKLSIILSSDYAEALNSTAQKLERDLRSIPTLSNISSTASLQRPEIIIRPNMERAAELGVSTETIGDVVRVATTGDFDAQLSKLNLDNRQIYVRVRVADKARQDINTIANLRVPTRNGTTALSSIADISMSTGPSQIDRYDRNRYVTVSADLGGQALGKALEDAMELPSIKNRPSNVNLIQTGDAEIMMELFTGFGIAMLTGISCVLCVLILLFKDFLQPVTIISALPLSFGGSVIALLITNGEMNLPTLIGIVMLMGVVTKNSILLVEYTIVSMRDRGMTPRDAVIDACHKRARPIVMTTIAMIAGMTPVALGFGGDPSFRQPMAIAVIGGLVTSTALSLLVVPVTFTYIQRFESWVVRKFKPSHV